jgi:hypothetical protein
MRSALTTAPIAASPPPGLRALPGELVQDLSGCQDGDRPSGPRGKVPQVTSHQRTADPRGDGEEWRTIRIGEHVRPRRHRNLEAEAVEDIEERRHARRRKGKFAPPQNVLIFGTDRSVESRLDLPGKDRFDDPAWGTGRREHTRHEHVRIDDEPHPARRRRRALRLLAMIASICLGLSRWRPRALASRRISRSA